MRHRYYRPTRWVRIPTWWYVVAFIIASAVALGVVLAGGIGLDSGKHDPDPPGSRVTPSAAPTVTLTETPDPAPTVTRTKVAPTVTETRVKTQPGPTVTVTRSASPQKVPGPTVTVSVPAPDVTRWMTETVTATPPAPASGGDGGRTVVQAPNGRGCMYMEIINGVPTYGPPFPC